MGQSIEEVAPFSTGDVLMWWGVITDAWGADGAAELEAACGAFEYDAAEGASYELKLFALG